MQPRQLQDKYMLRLPDGWRDAIKERAGRNRRSMNSEILAALESVVREETGAEIGVMSPVSASNSATLPGGASITKDERTVSDEYAR
jgi:plasmid stability protein